MAEIPETFHELLSSATTGVLATNGRDGYPQATAVWFRFHDGVIQIVMRAPTRKVRNLQDDPRCTFILIDPADFHRVIEVRADASLERESGTFPKANAVLAKYGTSVGQIEPGPNPTDRVIATLTPVKVNTLG